MITYTLITNIDTSGYTKHYGKVSDGENFNTLLIRADRVNHAMMHVHRYIKTEGVYDHKHIQDREATGDEITNLSCDIFIDIGSIKKPRRRKIRRIILEHNDKK